VRKKLYQQADIRNYYNKLMHDSKTKSSKHNGSSSSNSNSSSSKKQSHTDNSSSSSSKHAVVNCDSNDVSNTSEDTSSDVMQAEKAKLHS
jgi:hypothetical protein